METMDTTLRETVEIWLEHKGQHRICHLTRDGADAGKCPGDYTLREYLELVGFVVDKSDTTIFGYDLDGPNLRSENPVYESSVRFVTEDWRRHYRQAAQDAAERNNSDEVDMDLPMVELILRLVDSVERIAGSLNKIERLLDKRMHRQ